MVVDFDDCHCNYCLIENEDLRGAASAAAFAIHWG
jgi:hypothetical protein